MSKSKALVIGAGLGGLTSAAKLAQTEDYDVTVYERMSFAGGRFTQHDLSLIHISEPTRPS